MYDQESSEVLCFTAIHSLAKENCFNLSQTMIFSYLVSFWVQPVT